MFRDQMEWNRRQFLKLAATGAAAGVAAATFTGCTPNETSTLNSTSDTSTTPAPTQQNVRLEDQVWDFEVEPKYDLDAIKEEETHDVVVVGTATSGMHCIYALLEQGADVVGLEKLNSDSVVVGGIAYRRSVGFSWGFSYNSVAHNQGLKVEIDRIVQDQVRISNHKVDQKQIRRVVNLGPTVSDWQLKILREHGDDVDNLWVEDHPERHQTPLPTDATERPGQQDTYWHPLGYTIWAGDVEWALEEQAKAKFGFEVTYETTAKKLIKDDSGRVIGVIAQKADGTLVKYYGKKGVVLATGGYEGNKEMQKKYLTDADRYIVAVGKATNTGDGLLMGQWAGAKVEDWPHTVMTWDGMSPECIRAGYDYIGVARQAWLYVNAYGQRFMNEDVTFGGQGRSISIQPYAKMWTIFDDKYKDPDVEINLKGTVCRRMTTVYHTMPGPGGIMPFCTNEATQDLIDAGVILKADTLEELADLMIEKGPAFGIGNELDKEGFLKTVARYNELCEEGYDWDFGKDPICLYKVDKPPYYAVRSGCGFLVTQSGVYVDEHMRVLSKDVSRKPIEGLYAIGNVASGFNAFEFSMDTNLGSLGRAATTGYIAAHEVLGLPLEEDPKKTPFRNKNIFE
ncbi:MAG: FAD-binding protein [Coriobacteriales bacterium]|jgi:succinate dehydrogenase/fumarate reductase flavoprotein subunit|nr:FAD-binding protein [Coriobacteriales bacterium]